MNYLPNLVTSARLAAALALLWLCFASTNHGAPFFLPLFFCAGVSDLLDGIIARRFNLCTEFGARLDSIADLTLYIAVLIVLSFNLGPELEKCIWLMISGAFMQACHLSFSMFRFGKFPAYHTTYARVCAYLMFAGVIAFWLTKSSQIMALLAIIWMSCSLEGIVITLVLRQPLSNLRGVGAALSAK